MPSKCFKCGADLEEGSLFCDECGMKQPEKKEEPNVQQNVQQNSQSSSRPSAQTLDRPGNQASFNNMPNPVQNNVTRIKNSGYGIASLILGIISVISFGFLFLPELLGLIFGIIGCTKKNTKHGLSIAGIILSSIGTVLIILIMIGVANS